MSTTLAKPLELTREQWTAVDVISDAAAYAHLLSRIVSPVEILASQPPCFEHRVDELAEHFSFGGWPLRDLLRDVQQGTLSVADAEELLAIDLNAVRYAAFAIGYAMGRREGGAR